MQAAIDSSMQGRTVVVIAHRLSTVRRADKIIVLQDGAVEQTGTHESLLEQGGVYRDLVRRQLAAAEPGGAPNAAGGSAAGVQL